jgi:hypothetical protein
MLSSHLYQPQPYSRCLCKVHLGTILFHRYILGNPKMPFYEIQHSHPSPLARGSSSPTKSPTYIARLSTLPLFLRTPNLHIQRMKTNYIGCQKRANINRTFVHARGGTSRGAVAFAKLAADVENIWYDVLDVSSFSKRGFWLRFETSERFLGPPYSLVRRALLLSSFITMTNADINSIAR